MKFKLHASDLNIRPTLKEVWQPHTLILADCCGRQDLGLRREPSGNSSPFRCLSTFQQHHFPAQRTQYVSIQNQSHSRELLPRAWQHDLFNVTICLEPPGNASQSCPFSTSQQHASSGHTAAGHALSIMTAQQNLATMRKLGTILPVSRVFPAPLCCGLFGRNACQS